MPQQLFIMYCNTNYGLKTYHNTTFAAVPVLDCFIIYCIYTVQLFIWTNNKLGYSADIKNIVKYVDF